MTEEAQAETVDRPHLPCGRMAPHPAHAWLTRSDLWCDGTGGPGTTAPPLEDDEA